MYNFFTSAVTVWLLLCFVIYNTDFITVVTLGGTVLGSAGIGVLTALVSQLLCRMVPRFLFRIAAEILGNSCIIFAVVRYLPGWDMKPGAGTLLFLLLACLLIALLHEFILHEKQQ